MLPQICSPQFLSPGITLLSNSITSRGINFLTVSNCKVQIFINLFNYSPPFLSFPDHSKNDTGNIPRISLRSFFRRGNSTRADTNYRSIDAREGINKRRKEGLGNKVLRNREIIDENFEFQNRRRFVRSSLEKIFYSREFERKRSFISFVVVLFLLTGRHVFRLIYADRSFRDDLQLKAGAARSTR